MDKENKATETTTETIATQTTETSPAVDTNVDLEAKNVALEAEKARLIEERENYKLAYLKEKKKKEETGDELSDDERLRQIAREELANSRLTEIAVEQDNIIKKALKENSELKKAYLNKTTTTPPATMGSHSESAPVKDTLITPEQMAAFKQRGWTDKDIERYKKNLQKYSGR